MNWSIGSTYHPKLQRGSLVRVKSELSGYWREGSPGSKKYGREREAWQSPAEARV